jgi:hypothetical protein
MASATLLLPPAARFGKQGLRGDVLGDDLRAALARADRSAHADSGRRAQLLRHFELSPRGWPIAALTRQADVGDAGEACWLRADPAYVRPDINGARLMACGDALALDDEDVAALLPSLQSVFDAADCTLDAPQSSRWCLRLPRDIVLPAFDDPDEALGEDLFDHLVEGEAGRHWRALLSEAQVTLHNHPWNAQRAARGKPPVNAVWFWGGGVLPTKVRALHARTFSEEETARALAHASCTVDALPLRFPGAGEDDVFDLSSVHDPSQLVGAWLRPALACIRDRTLHRLELDFEDGAVFLLALHQRWRFWRKRLTTPG